VPIVLKSGSLNLLEHSGAVQTCNGIALTLLYLLLFVLINIQDEIHVSGKVFFFVLFLVNRRLKNMRHSSFLSRFWQYMNGGIEKEVHYHEKFPKHANMLLW
jgi:hypothetical protein